MKNIFISLMVIYLSISSFKSYGQYDKNHLVFPSTDYAVWDVFYRDGKTSGNLERVWNYHLFYYTLGDTQFNSNGYKKVYQTRILNHFSTADTLVCFYRYDTMSRKVYVRSAHTYHNDTNEYLIYDFNPPTVKYDTIHSNTFNDSITLPLWVKPGKFEQRKFIKTFYINDTNEVTLLNGQVRISIFLRYLPLDTVNMVWYEKSYRHVHSVHEGVGSTSHPFYYPCLKGFNDTEQKAWEFTQMKYGIDTALSLVCHVNKYFRTADFFMGLPYYCAVWNWMGMESIIEDNSNLEVFPNPVSDYLYIKGLESDFKIGEIYIYNSLGQQVITKKAQEIHNGIDINDLPNGIYYIMYSSNSKEMKAKFIKVSN